LKRTAVLVDISNLYYCVSNTFKGRKLDYDKYLKFVETMGSIDVRIAYGAQLNNQADNFIKYLKHLGFETKYKTPKIFQNQKGLKVKADNDVDMAIDMVRLAGTVDMMLLGSADGDMLPAVKYVLEHDTEVVVLASKISSELRPTATKCIEIFEGLLADGLQVPR